MTKRSWWRTVVVVVVVAAGCASAPRQEERTAAGADRLARARGEVEDAKPFVEKANDLALPQADRRAAATRAVALLKDARAGFDAHLDAHAEDTESLDAEYVHVTSLLFWMRKAAAD